MTDEPCSIGLLDVPESLASQDPAAAAFIEHVRLVNAAMAELWHSADFA